MRDKMIGREFKQGIRIIDNLDILQLPRPRNPGGILPLNGHNLFNSPNEALNLSLDDGQKSKPRPGNIQSVSSFSPVVSMSALKRPNTSYLISNIIRTTPNRLRVSNNTTAATFGSLASRSQGCAINESVERPLPSSVVDSEGVAKKIAWLVKDISARVLVTLYGIKQVFVFPQSLSFYKLLGFLLSVIIHVGCF